MKHIETPEDLLKDFCNLFKLPKHYMVSQCRKHEIVRPRQLLCYVGVTYYKFTLKGMGNCLGGRDHGTIIGARDLIKGLIENKEQKTMDQLKIIIEHLELPGHTGAYELLESKFKRTLKDINQLKFEIKDLKIKLVASENKYKKQLSLS